MANVFVYKANQITATILCLILCSSTGFSLTGSLSSTSVFPMGLSKVVPQVEKAIALISLKNPKAIPPVRNESSIEDLTPRAI
jgi:hypothetical protein